jgi:hypothetical protein
VAEDIVTVVVDDDAAIAVDIDNVVTVDVVPDVCDMLGDVPYSFTSSLFEEGDKDAVLEKLIGTRVGGAGELSFTWEGTLEAYVVSCNSPHTEVVSVCCSLLTLDDISNFDTFPLLVATSTFEEEKELDTIVDVKDVATEDGPVECISDIVVVVVVAVVVNADGAK